jgi:hypothetical protein
MGEYAIRKSSPICVASLMPDYYPLIARAVSKLENGTPTARQVVFRRARTILMDQLRLRQPPASNSEIMYERAALEDAIRKVESASATLRMPNPGTGHAPHPNVANGLSPFRVLEQPAMAKSAPRRAGTYSERQSPTIESTTGHNLERFHRRKKHAHGLQAFFERARMFLIDQLPPEQSPASVAEYTNRHATHENTKRKTEPKSTKLAIPQTGAVHTLGAECAGVSTRGICEQSAAADGTASSPRPYSTGEYPTKDSSDTANTAILSNLRGIQWLDQLIRDGSRPLAPQKLRQDARAVLQWLSVSETEVIKTKHYDQFGRAIQGYIMEGYVLSGGSATTTSQSLNLGLNDDIREIFSRLLDREQAAMVFDKGLTWFAKIWMMLIVVLNFIGVIGLLIGAPTLWTGIVSLSEIYLFNMWSWIGELVALSPALGALAWSDRRLKHPWVATLITFEFLKPARLRRSMRRPATR